MISVRKDLFPPGPPAPDISAPQVSRPASMKSREVDIIDGFTFLSYTSLEDLNGDHLDKVFNVNHKIGSQESKTPRRPKVSDVHVRRYFAAETLISIEKQLVMGRLRGHPFWPGVVLSWKSNSKSENRQGKGTVVRYLGEPTFSLVDETEMRPFSTSLPKHFGRFSRKKKLQFLFAFSEASALTTLKKPLPSWTSGNGRCGAIRKKNSKRKVNGRNFRRCVDVDDVFLREDVDDDDIDENFKAFERSMAKDCGSCSGCQRAKDRRKRFICAVKNRVEENKSVVRIPPSHNILETTKSPEKVVGSSTPNASKVFELRKLPESYKNTNTTGQTLVYKYRPGSCTTSTLPLKKRYTASLQASSPAAITAKKGDSTTNFIAQLQKQVVAPNQEGQPEVMSLFSPGKQKNVQPSVNEFFPSRKSEELDSDRHEKEKVFKQFLRLTNEQKRQPDPVSKSKPDVPPHVSDPSLILKAVNLIPKTDHNGNHVKAIPYGRALRSRSTLRSVKVAEQEKSPESSDKCRFTTDDLAVLYESFDKNPNPKSSELESIAKELQLRDAGRVRAWFANQRARARQESKFLQDLQRTRAVKETRAKNSRYSFRKFSHIKGYVIVTGDDETSSRSSEESSEENVEITYVTPLNPVEVIGMDHNYCPLTWNQN